MRAEFVGIRTDIWENPRFTAIDTLGQWTYFVLRAQREISTAGVLRIFERRWSNYARGVTPADVHRGLVALADADFAVPDWGLEEIFVRGHIRLDSSPKQIVGVAAALSEVESPIIRAAVKATLRQVFERQATRQRKPGKLARIRLSVYEKCDYRCMHCAWSPVVPDAYDGTYALPEWMEHPNGSLSVVMLELDHIYPASLGGKFEESNLQALCSPCNIRKGARVA